jgi:hypothetical protein
MLTMDRIRNAQGLWGVLLPEVTQPEPRQFLLWGNRFTDAQIERAITRAHRKLGQPLSGGLSDAATVHRYITGVLLNLEREERSAQHHSVDVPLGTR